MIDESNVSGGRDGFLYVLLNLSMPGLVKVGMTRRSPEDRAKELSSATGIPTPFELIFDVFVSNCSEAEAYVHTLLEAEGYRVSASREFFNAPVKRIIKALIKAETEFPPKAEASSIASRDQHTDVGLDIKLWKGIVHQADLLAAGRDGILRDIPGAIKLYRQAMKLGSGEAAWKAAKLLLSDLNKKNLLEAVQTLKDGAGLDSPECLSELGFVYLGRYDSKKWKIRNRAAATHWFEKYFEVTRSQAGFDEARLGVALKIKRSCRSASDDLGLQDVNDLLISYVRSCENDYYGERGSFDERMNLLHRIQELEGMGVFSRELRKRYEDSCCFAKPIPGLQDNAVENLG